MATVKVINIKTGKVYHLPEIEANKLANNKLTAGTFRIEKAKVPQEVADLLNAPVKPIKRGRKPKQTSN